MVPERLVDGIARFHGLEPNQVTVGAGSIAVIAHALAAVVEPGEQVLYGWRSFEAYPIVTGVAGAEAVTVPVTEDQRLDLEAMAAAVTPRTRAVLVCSPNNPTGPAVRQTEFEQFMAAVPSDVLVILDEAYVEFVTDPLAVDGLAALHRYSNLMVLRTFSKAYGLAGLRVGYALGRPRLIEAVRTVTTPFSVSVMAELGALFSLQLQDELAQRIQTVVETRNFMVEGLAAQGWEVPDAQGNFIWLDLGADAVPFSDACQRAGLLVRPFPNHGVRVSVGERPAAERLLEVASTWI
jgi:histidinol-phosphate aminotransferase